MSSLVSTRRRTAGTVLASQGEPVTDVMVVTSGRDRGHLWSVSAISDVEIHHCSPGEQPIDDWGVVR